LLQLSNSSNVTTPDSSNSTVSESTNATATGPPSPSVSSGLPQPVFFVVVLVRRIRHHAFSAAATTFACPALVKFFSVSNPTAVLFHRRIICRCRVGLFLPQSARELGYGTCFQPRELPCFESDRKIHHLNGHRHTSSRILQPLAANRKRCG
jgi:hypothetical protein